MKRSTLALAAALCLLPLSAIAHKQWMVPSATVVAGQDDAAGAGRHPRHRDPLAAGEPDRDVLEPAQRARGLGEGIDVGAGGGKDMRVWGSDHGPDPSEWVLPARGGTGLRDARGRSRTGRPGR